MPLLAHNSDDVAGKYHATITVILNAVKNPDFETLQLDASPIKPWAQHDG